MNGTVGVLIPCHNYARFLPDAWESLLSQTRLPDRVVIIDDASSDDTSETATRLVANCSFATVVRNTSNLGAVATFNRGLSKLDTDYIMVLSADDMLSTEYLAECAAVLDAGFDVSLSSRRSFGHDEEFLSPGEWKLDRLLLANEHHGSNLFRRSLFERVGGYQQHRMEDWAFWMRASALGATAAAAPLAVLHYRKHGPSRNVHSNWELRRDRFETWRAVSDVVAYRQLFLAFGSVVWQKTNRMLRQKG
jgi:glycosyltransferase involved in cell wall biosynthesis